MKYLIVNADDYGLHPSVSAGIRKAHLEGILTSTTTMMNMPDARPALEMAAEQCPNLGLGVHLTLTAGIPLLQPEKLPALMRLSDGTRFPREAVLREQAASIPATEVKGEWRAQIERFIQLTGKNPDHLDSHHNSSYYTYPFFEAMLKLAAEYHCAVRLPFWEITQSMPGDYVTLPKDWPAGLSPRKQTKNARVLFPDDFVGYFYDEKVTLEILQYSLENLKEGVTELMSHPALADESLKQISSYNSQRAVELSLLLHPLILGKIKDNGINLITFGQMLELSK